MSDWKTIEDFPDYSVNELGDVKRDDRDRLVKPTQNQQGIVSVSLYSEGRLKRRALGLIVANTFLPPPRNEFYDSVINLNGDKTDCRAVNLMRRPRWFAVRYFRMFYNEPYRITAYVPEIDSYFGSLRTLCTLYGLVEEDVIVNMRNRTQVFHHGWLIFQNREEYEDYARVSRQAKDDEMNKLYKRRHFNRFT